MSNSQLPLDDIAEKIHGGVRMLGGLKQGAESQVRRIVESAHSQLDVDTHQRIHDLEPRLHNRRQ